MAALYITFEAVRVRLIGKVKFTEDEDDENKMHVDLALRLIEEAEGAVEQALSPRYLAPFQGDGEGAFSGLPDRPTSEILRTLCELQSVIRILETDFGSGTAVQGDKYRESIQKRYDKMVEDLLAKRKDGGVESQGWRYPPLPGLALNYQNTEADDGYMGTVIVANGSESQGYARGQINDPSNSYWNDWNWRPY